MLFRRRPTYVFLTVLALLLVGVFMQRVFFPSHVWKIGFWVTDMAISPDGAFLATAQTPAGRLHSGGAESHTQAETQRAHVRRVSDGAILQTLGHHDDDVRAVAFSPTGQVLATGSADHTVKLWQVQTGQLITTLVLNNADVESVAFSPNGAWLAAGTAHKVMLWRVDDWSLTQQYLRQGPRVAFSPDSAFLASAGSDGFTVWRTASQQVLMEQRDRGAYAFAWSPSGQHVAVSHVARFGEPGTEVVVWRVNDWQPTVILDVPAPNNFATSMAWRPRGDLLAAGLATLSGPLRQGVADTGEIQLWQVDDWNVRETLKAHDDIIEVLVWTPTSDLLLSGSNDGTIRTWQMSPNE